LVLLLFSFLWYDVVYVGLYIYIFGLVWCFLFVIDGFNEEKNIKEERENKALEAGAGNEKLISGERKALMVLDRKAGAFSLLR